MKAIILAAGRGSRMGSLTDRSHKCLTIVKGKRLLDWQLDALNEVGISDIGIVTGYRRSDFFGLGLTEFFNENWESTNMVSSLRKARNWLVDGPCIISYSDIFYEPSAVMILKESKKPVAITYDPNWLALWINRFGDPLLDAESFRVNDSGHLTEIGKKPKNVEEIQGQYMGLIKVTPNGWHACEMILDQLDQKTQESIDMTSLINMLVSNDQVNVEALRYEGKWGEIDFESDFLLFNSS